MFSMGYVYIKLAYTHVEAFSLPSKIVASRRDQSRKLVQKTEYFNFVTKFVHELQGVALRELIWFLV